MRGETRAALRRNVIRRRSPAEREGAGDYLPAALAHLVAARELVSGRREVATAEAARQARVAAHPSLAASDAHAHVVGLKRRDDEEGVGEESELALFVHATAERSEVVGEHAVERRNVALGVRAYVLALDFEHGPLFSRVRDGGRPEVRGQT